MRIIGLILAGLALGACQQAASEPAADPPAKVATAAAPATAATPALPAPDHCFIQVGGTVYLDQPCAGRWSDDGDWIGINTGPGEEPVVFAILIQDGEVWTADWSGAEGGSHAHDRIGEVTREGRCWTATGVRLCIPEAGTSPSTPE